MKVVIANRHWKTSGGGEAYALAIARSLTRHGADVTLLGPPGTPWDTVADRFGFDAAPREADFDDEEAVAEAGSSFDLFVNTGHATQLPNPAGKGLLVVHFPRDHGTGLRPAQRRLLRTLVRGGHTRNRRVVWGPGFHASGEVGRLLRWTDGHGTVVLDPPPAPGTPVTITFGSDRPTATEVEVSVGPEIVTVAVVPDEPRSVTVEAGAGAPTRIEVTGDTFVPAEVWEGVTDERPHGVPVVDVAIGDGVFRRLVDRVEAWRRSELLGFATTYDALLCHSSYTSTWVERWWGLTPEVVEPPVPPRSPGEKQPVILAVGRFFDPRRGHSKRQLELVEAFRALVERGVEGWELHLVGGCDPEDADYLERIRAAASGLPVTIHVDAAADELDDLYGRASIFWHAAGLGVDVQTDPEAHEHFGIAVVEAMSAGAVPIVHGTGGPAEIVHHEVDGLHFHAASELVEQTRWLIDGPNRRESLATAARMRSRNYTFDRFDARVAQLVDAL